MGKVATKRETAASSMAERERLLDTCKQSVIMVRWESICVRVSRADNVKASGQGTGNRPIQELEVESEGLREAETVRAFTRGSMGINSVKRVL
jgi:hypothetical protein